MKKTRPAWAFPIFGGLLAMIGVGAGFAGAEIVIVAGVDGGVGLEFAVWL